MVARVCNLIGQEGCSQFKASLEYTMGLSQNKNIHWWKIKVEKCSSTPSWTINSKPLSTVVILEISFPSLALFYNINVTILIIVGVCVYEVCTMMHVWSEDIVMSL